MEKHDGIKIPGYRGTWSEIDDCVVNGTHYRVMESDKWGDEAPCIVINDNREVLFDDCYNGIDQIYEYFEI